jgi:enoyl-CoA hydratase
MTADLDESGGVLTLTLRRPEKLNALNPDMTARLWEAVTALGERPDLRVLVIRATGRYFTAGIDLAAVPGFDGPARYPSDIAYRRAYRRHHLLYDEMEAVEKPIITAIQGPCVGAGVEMAASCDFRFASSAATFSLPEVRIGVIAGSGGTSRLTRLVGPHWAKWIAVAGQTVGAHQASQIGFVHEVVEPGDLDNRVAAFAAELAGFPLESLGAAKLVVDACADTDRTTQRNIERLANTPLNAADPFRSLIADRVDRSP